MNSAPSETPLIYRLPELRSLDSLPLEGGDVIVHAPGFEDRTMAICEMVVPGQGTGAVLFDYLPFKQENKLSDVRGGLLDRGIKVEEDDILKYNRFEPGDFETRLRARLLAQRARRAVVDISTMSKLLIMLVLNVCHELDLVTSVLYSESLHYGPSEDEFNRAKRNNEIHRPSLQVFTGVHGVVRVDSLASVAMQGQPTAALVFMSFNDALTQILLNSVYPSRLFLINGRPPVHSWREAATAWIHDRVRREWQEDNPETPTIEGGIAIPARAVSTLDYRETVSLLLELYWQLSSHHRVLLAPAGSKQQAVGSFLVKALHPDIHIEYPSPEGFFANYSSGIGAHWLLDLGKIPKLLKGIADAERRKYLEIHA
jgi:hypothetical protein